MIGATVTALDTGASGTVADAVEAGPYAPVPGTWLRVRFDDGLTCWFRFEGL